MRKWRSAVVTAAWVAVGTAAGALGAWQLAGADSRGDVAHSRPLDEAAVRRALAKASESPAAPERSRGGDSTPPRKPTGKPSAPERSTVRFTGGAATVECRADGTVFLVSWSPADGFHIDDDVERGPAAVARLEAEPGDDDERDDLPYEIRCASDGVPHAKVTADRDDD
ncbi:MULTISPECIES: hypothetical protein [unclassified Streptomyces]|uniref:hypothetical protein n=1 Tax=unclassified Streptomyces TaxID=2593676 RepID=UPI001CBC466F|nr:MULTISPECIES: hypothetical protein [unclassified Streptomyces]WPO72437.1 hypothetical protein R9806_18255 [Streptomyces sp. KN37]